MMRKITTWSVCVAFLLAVSPINQIVHAAQAQAPAARPAAQTPPAQAPAARVNLNGKGIIQGTAMDALKVPLAGALIRLQNGKSSTHTVLETTSSATGTFTFTGVDAGTYVLRALKQGKTI